MDNTTVYTFVALILVTSLGRADRSRNTEPRILQPSVQRTTPKPQTSLCDKICCECKRGNTILDCNPSKSCPALLSIPSAEDCPNCLPKEVEEVYINNFERIKVARKAFYDSPKMKLLKIESVWKAEFESTAFERKTIRCNSMGVPFPGPMAQLSIEIINSTVEHFHRKTFIGGVKRIYIGNSKIGNIIISCF